MRHTVTFEEWIEIRVTVRDALPPLPPGYTREQVEELDRRWRAMPMPDEDRQLKVELHAAFPPGYLARLSP